jgi:hypothetical protein
VDTLKCRAKEIPAPAPKVCDQCEQPAVRLRRDKLTDWRKHMVCAKCAANLAELRARSAERDAAIFLRRKQAEEDTTDAEALFFSRQDARRCVALRRRNLKARDVASGSSTVALSPLCVPEMKTAYWG